MIFRLLFIFLFIFTVGCKNKKNDDEALAIYLLHKTYSIFNIRAVNNSSVAATYHVVYCRGYLFIASLDRLPAGVTSADKSVTIDDSLQQYGFSLNVQPNTGGSYYSTCKIPSIGASYTCTDNGTTVTCN